MARWCDERVEIEMKERGMEIASWRLQVVEIFHSSKRIGALPL